MGGVSDGPAGERQSPGFRELRRTPIDDRWIQRFGLDKQQQLKRKIPAPVMRMVERAGLDDPNKCLHRGKTVHAYSLKE
jgi:hypothetical protein